MRNVALWAATAFNAAFLASLAWKEMLGPAHQWAHATATVAILVSAVTCIKLLIHADKGVEPKAPYGEPPDKPFAPLFNPQSDPRWEPFRAWVGRKTKRNVALSTSEGDPTDCPACDYQATGIGPAYDDHLCRSTEHHH